MTPPPAGGSPTTGPTAVPTQSVEEMGNETDTILSAEMDADFKSIDSDLKQLDEKKNNLIIMILVRSGEWQPGRRGNLITTSDFFDKSELD